MFVASTILVLGDGESTLSWLDQWIQGRSVTSLAPDLILVVSPCLWATHTVAFALVDNSWVGHIRGALTVPIISQFLVVWDAAQLVHLSSGTGDGLVWRWTSDQHYSPALPYHTFFVGHHFFPCVDLLWQAKGPAKCKLFLWLAFQQHCWMAYLLHKRGIDRHLACLFCT